MEERNINLIIFTFDYPFGHGETFLEVEIMFAAIYFKKIYVISTSRNNEQTRQLPKNVTPIKISRNYFPFSCILHVLRNIFSWKVIEELRDVIKLKHKPGLIKMMKAWVITWGLEKRYQIMIRTLALHPQSTVAYSYWLASSAYFIASNSSLWRYSISRAHAFELRDYEDYIPFRKIIDKGIDKICFISKFAQEEYNKIMFPIMAGEKRAEQRIERLGVNICNETHAAEDKTSFRIVSCSAINKLKRLDIIIQALAELNSTILIEWIHFGWGPDADHIEKMCVDLLDSNEHLRWQILGWKSNQEVMDYYRQNHVDLFINTSDVEGVPVSIMEAMSFGIPTMARDVGGIREIVIDGVTGYLLPQSVLPGDITRKLEDIIQKGASASIMPISRESVRGFVMERYDGKENYMKFYTELLKAINA